MDTNVEPFRLVGATVWMRVNIHTNEQEEMLFPVRINSYKNRFGKHFFLVQPVNGKGENWVAIDKLQLPD